MKLLLTDSGVRNAAIMDALVGLLGRPVAESTALCIPTAGYGSAHADPFLPWRFISGQAAGPMTGLGWKAVGVLELTALPSIDRDLWVSWVREADVLLVNGGDTLYLARWMRESGLADLLPSLTDTVYVGLSAGSIVATPKVCAGRPPTGADDRGLGLVDLSLFVHLDDARPDSSMAAAERWAAGLDGPGYATDTQTALRVVDGVVDVVSQGVWRYFDGSPAAPG